MQKKRRSAFFIFVVIFFLLLSLPLFSDARQGCCSQNGGVCGCECCDGTPLSDKCIPHYPGCNQSSDSSPVFLPESVVEPVEAQEESPGDKDMNESYFQVTEVVDGDTIKVDIEGEIKKVRLIGIDTPETVDPRRPVECFGKEASRKMKELVENQEVRLLGDEKSDNEDKYQRLLRYVYLKDGTFINELMVKEGFAYAYIKYPFEYLEDFKASQLEAEEERRGLWAEGVCEIDVIDEEEKNLDLDDQDDQKNEKSIADLEKTGSDGGSGDLILSSSLLAVVGAVAEMIFVGLYLVLRRKIQSGM